MVDRAPLEGVCAATHRGFESPSLRHFKKFFMNALNTLGKLAQKPSDKKIRTWRIIFAILLILVIVFGWNSADFNISAFDYKFFDIPYDNFIVPVLFIFPLVGLIRGIFDPGLFKKSVWKWVIFGLGVAMFIIATFLLSEKAYISPNTQTTTEITNETTQAKDVSEYFAVVDTDDWLGFFGLITMFVGFFLNGRNLTTKNEKFGEVIKKIRV